MKNYFTISEFAKLRGININSLRYYEKLGILKPAHIDKKTNYRYYSAEQVSILNKIILCIHLGIPLKEMAEYIDEDGNLQSQRLLERGRIEAKRRMQELQNNLNFIESSLENIEDNKKYADKKEIYYRKLKERKVITTKDYEQMPDFKEMLLEVGKIYKTAQENALFPVLPAGQIWKVDCNGNAKFCFFLEIMNYQQEHKKIITLPEGEYACLQIDLSPKIDLDETICKFRGDDYEKLVVVDNVMLEKYSFETRPSELQKIII